MESREVLMGTDCVSSSSNGFELGGEDVLRKGKLAEVYTECWDGMGGRLAVDDPKLGFRSREVGFNDTVKFDDVRDGFENHGKMMSVLHSLRNVTRELFRKVGEEIELAKVGWSTELIGLSRSSSEKQMESLLYVEMVLEFLRTKLDDVLSDANDVLMASETELYSHYGGDLVMQTALRSIFEENIWKHESPFQENHDAIWVDKLNEVSGLFAQLDAIVKSLHVGDLAHSQHGASTNRVSTTSLFEEIKPAEESSVNVPESYDYKPLSHMSNEELVSYFNTIIATMKRDHESALQQKTEEYFLLKREYLKERGSSVAQGRSSEFDVIRKKIPEVITKLEDFLSSNKSSPAVISDVEHE